MYGVKVIYFLTNTKTHNYINTFGHTSTWRLDTRHLKAYPTTKQMQNREHMRLFKIPKHESCNSYESFRIHHYFPFNWYSTGLLLTHSQLLWNHENLHVCNTLRHVSWSYCCYDFWSNEKIYDSSFTKVLKPCILWKLTGGAPGKFMFHIELDEGSVSLRLDTARLYRAQFAFSRSLLEPTTVFKQQAMVNMNVITG